MARQLRRLALDWPVLSLIAGRLALGIATLGLVSLVVFAGTEILPGDVAQVVLGQSATPESLHELRKELGLDRSMAMRYVDWLGGALHLDFGMSLARQVPVNVLVSQRIGNTILLAVVSGLFAVPLGLALGLVAAMYPGSTTDRVISGLALCLAALPQFFLATVLVLIFSVNLRWLPAISYIVEYRSLEHLAASLVMPVVTLAAGVISQISRMVRSIVVNVMDSPYCEMALLKGVPRHRIVMVHALRNAIGPLANIVALNLAYLVSGVVVVEVIFAYPGLASLAVEGVQAHDFPVIQACVMIFCFAYSFLMIIADIIAIASNPRLHNAR